MGSEFRCPSPDQVRPSWLGDLPDSLVGDPRQWPRLLDHHLPEQRGRHGIEWFAALAAESMRRLRRRQAYPGFDNRVALCGNCAAPGSQPFWRVSPRRPHPLLTV